MSTTRRIFSDEELDLLATPLSIRLERVAHSGDQAEIDRIVEQMNQECLAIYDAYVSWLGVLQTFIVEHAGEAAHDQALTWVGEYGARPFVRSYAGLGARGRAVELARRLRASGSTFDVEEDARRIRFRLDPWGPVRWWREPAGFEGETPRQRAGDRIRYPCYGYFGPPVSFVTLSGSRPFTQGRDRLACVLATEIQFLEIIPIELFGYPVAAVELPGAGDEPTWLDVYKDPVDIPARVYGRVGSAMPAGCLPAESGERRFDDAELERLATPLSVQVEQASADGDGARLRDIAAHMDEELVGAKDPLGVMIAGLLSWIAWHLGEQAAEEALVRTADVVMAPFVAAVRDLDIADALPLWAMVWRAHGSTFWIEEQDDKFVLRGRPLGACHRMWSHAYQQRVERISDSRIRYPTFGCFDPPASFHLMREPRPITHGKVGYPIYSCHCHMLHEIYPIERLGRPLWVELHPLDDRDGETVHIHYKDPSAWPEHYYQQVGQSKPASVGSPL